MRWRIQVTCSPDKYYGYGRISHVPIIVVGWYSNTNINKTREGIWLGVRHSSQISPDNYDDRVNQVQKCCYYWYSNKNEQDQEVHFVLRELLLDNFIWYSPIEIQHYSGLPIICYHKIQMNCSTLHYSIITTTIITSSPVGVGIMMALKTFNQPLWLLLHHNALSHAIPTYFYLNLQIASDFPDLYDRHTGTTNGNWCVDCLMTSIFSLTRRTPN